MIPSRTRKIHASHSACACVLYIIYFSSFRLQKCEFLHSLSRSTHLCAYCNFCMYSIKMSSKLECVCFSAPLHFLSPLLFPLPGSLLILFYLLECIWYFHIPSFSVLIPVTLIESKMYFSK